MSGRVEDNEIKSIEVGHRERLCEQVAAESGHRLQPLRIAHRHCEGGQGGAVGIDGLDPSLPGKAQREGADTAKEIGRALGALGMAEDESAKSLLACGRRLQKRTRRHRHFDPAAVDRR